MPQCLKRNPKSKKKRAAFYPFLPPGPTLFLFLYSKMWKGCSCSLCKPAHTGFCPPHPTGNVLGKVISGHFSVLISLGWSAVFGSVALLSESSSASFALTWPPGHLALSILPSSLASLSPLILLGSLTAVCRRVPGLRPLPFPFASPALVIEIPVLQRPTPCQMYGSSLGLCTHSYITPPCLFHISCLSRRHLR